MLTKLAKSWLLPAFVFIFAIAAWLFIASRERQALAPPSVGDNLEAFAELMPEPTRLVQINVAGTNRFVWVGETALWSLPSGPSCYVFDSDGKLLEWNSSTGDGEPTTRYMRSAWNAAPLTIAQAIKLIPDA